MHTITFCNVAVAAWRSLYQSRAAGSFTWDADDRPGRRWLQGRGSKPVLRVCRQRRFRVGTTLPCVDSLGMICLSVLSVRQFMNNIGIGSKICKVMGDPEVWRDTGKTQELGKTWEEVQSEDDREMMEDRDDDWSDWQARPLYAVCLFCEHQSETMDQIYTHMQDRHGFDLHKLKAEFNLKFYQQVKLVNFIRREVHQCRCYGCQEKFDSREAVVQHMRDAAHAMALPPQSTWDQPQYYFPTYENDGLLCALSDSDGESDPAGWGADVPVISEDVSTLEALRQNSVLGHLLEDRDSPPMGPGAV